MAIVKDTASFVARAIEIHGNKYDYSQTEYTAASKPVTIICRNCGPITLAYAGCHISTKRCGCGKCNHLKAMEDRLRTPCKTCGQKGKLSGGKCDKCRKSVVFAPCSRCGTRTRGKTCTKCRLEITAEKRKKNKFEKKLTSIARAEFRRVERLQAQNDWVRWSYKRAITVCQLRKRQACESIAEIKSFGCFAEWADYRIQTLRSGESDWQKKARRWARSLSDRQGVK